jgi:rhamnose utilization protein RhaD (predicted bifunctional aldolase and dehydrogenase)
MSKNISSRAELLQLRKLSARIGSDLQFTQASSGNSSIKLDDTLCIKASGRWMADALNENVLIPLNMAEVQKCVKRNIDPVARFEGASIETAMHAVLPHRVVLHLHCVNTIAWAVRKDAPLQLEDKLAGLRWNWIPHVPSGLPLAQKIENVLSAEANTNVFILGNHGLVIGGDYCGEVEDLLSQVEQRLAIRPRVPERADYSALAKIASGSSWDLPDDDEVHALGTDALAQEVLSGGLLYPAQSVFLDSCTPELFLPISFPEFEDEFESQYSSRPLLIIKGRGVIVKRAMTRAQHAMLSGLTRVIQRISSHAPIRYLTGEEVANSNGANPHYREIASASRDSAP